MMMVVPMALALALCACGTAGEPPPSRSAGEAGISFLADPSEQAVAFAMKRGGGDWQDITAHQGPFDSSTYDHALDPGERVEVRASTAGADGAAVSVRLPVQVENGIAYGMVAAVSANDPTAQCMGCGTPVSAPIDPGAPEGERLWLYETYNGISAPIMF